jgi:hypothetical protein
LNDRKHLKMPKPIDDEESWDGEHEDGRTYNPEDGNWITDGD